MLSETCAFALDPRKIAQQITLLSRFCIFALPFLSTLISATLRYKPRPGRENFTRNFAQGHSARRRSRFWPSPSPDMPHEQRGSSVRKRANKQQTNNATLTDFSSFISYVLIKCSGQPKWWITPRLA